jgi:hypothetical protein
MPGSRNAAQTIISGERILVQIRPRFAPLACKAAHRTKIAGDAARSSRSEGVGRSVYSLSPHGLLAADARAAIRCNVIEEVVVPCLRAIASPAPLAPQGDILGVSLST